MFGREPSLIIAVIATMIQAILIFVMNDVNAGDAVQYIIPGITMLMGVLTRKKP